MNQELYQRLARKGAAIRLKALDAERQVLLRMVYQKADSPASKLRGYQFKDPKFRRAQSERMKARWAEWHKKHGKVRLDTR